MDPRTAAKVTAPDLLKAFTEGTGREPEDSGNQQVMVWLILTKGDDVLQLLTYDITRLGEAMTLAGNHLCNVEDAAALFFTGTEEPAIVDDARKAISDGSGD